MARGRLGELLAGVLGGYELLFTLGKGGVGKTTISLAAALSAPPPRLVVSLDPAGHLAEYASTKPGVLAEPEPGLSVLQVDVEAESRRVAGELASLVRRLASATSVYSTWDPGGLLEEAPGVLEEAMLRALHRTLSLSGYRVRVYDMPPSVSLRVLAAPRLYAEWLRLVESVRLAYLERKLMAARAQGAARVGEVVESDAVLARVRAARRRYEELASRIASAGFIVVATPEPLAVWEAKVILERLTRLGFKPALVVSNRTCLGSDGGLVEAAAEYRTPILRVPCADSPPSSVGDVRRLLNLEAELLTA